MGTILLSIGCITLLGATVWVFLRLDRVNRQRIEHRRVSMAKLKSPLVARLKSPPRAVILRLVGGSPYLCWRPPVKVGSAGCFLCLASFRPMCSGRWTAVGVEVERPQRSEDERPRGRRGSTAYSGRPGTRRRRCGSSHLRPPVNGQQVSTLRVPAPSLIWVRGRKSGDMMIDGVPDVRAAERVRPLILSGKSTQQRGGDRKTAGAGRRHQLLFGQGTCATHS